jgi:hypothetical protein
LRTVWKILQTLKSFSKGDEFKEPLLFKSHPRILLPMSKNPLNPTDAPALPSQPVKADNPWLNLIFNIALPVLILNKGGAHIGSFYALLLAIFFPLAYGLHDLYKSHKINWISVLGLCNVLLTGSLALSGKTGLWFACKEAAFPLLIGLFVWFSSYTPKPALSYFVLNPQAFNIDKMNLQLDTEEKKLSFDKLVRKSTRFLSLSFAVSATLNFTLATRIFSPINTALAPEIQSQTLNEQIAKMTQMSFMVILIPSLLILLGIILHFSGQFKKITGTPLEDYFHS